MMRRTLLIAMLAGSLGVAPRGSAWAASAPAGDESEADYVRDVVGRAAAHVEAGRYEDALAVLDRAERERPLPVFVYVRATIEERRGNCERAVALYRRFLGLDPSKEDARDARHGMERCGEAPPASPAAPSAASPGEPAVAGSPAPRDEPVASDDPPPRRWYADPLADALAATGTAGMITGVGLVLGGRAQAREAPAAATLQGFDDRSHRAIVLDRAGLITLGIGSALVLGGVIRWAVVGTAARRRATAWSPGASGLLVRF